MLIAGNSSLILRDQNTEDKMVGRHHQLNGHEFEQILGDGDGQGSLVCCSPWGRKESDTTEHQQPIKEAGGTCQRGIILLSLWLCDT